MGDGDGLGARGGRRAVLVIHNPAAGRRRQRALASALAGMEAAGAFVTVHMTRSAGDAEAVARETRGAWDVVVASGGDGTVNEVINGLCARPEGVGVPALGILPLGTANLLARELAYPRRPYEVGRLMAEGGLSAIHLGECNGRRFTLMAGAGFDGTVVDRADMGLKRRLGRVAYAVSALRELAAYDQPPCEVSVDGGPPRRAWSVVVAKGRRYGGDFHVARDADVAEPTLHVCTLERPGRLAMLSCILGIAMGAVDRVPGFRVVSARSVRLWGRHGAPVQVDGDRGWSLPVEIGVSRTPLVVVAP